METYALINRPFPDIPDRFVPVCEIHQYTHSEAMRELDKLAGILWDGAQQLNGLYLRMCDLIRSAHLSEHEIRTVLGKHFPAPRVSEFVRVANAPHEVYRKYRAGFFGFKAALERTRGYRCTPSERLKQRQAQRAAIRLAGLIGEGSLTVSSWRITVERSA